jgi:hypothetical protein
MPNGEVMFVHPYNIYKKLRSTGAIYCYIMKRALAKRVARYFTQVYVNEECSLH